MVAIGSADARVGDGGHLLGPEVDAGAGNDSRQQSRGMEVVAMVGLVMVSHCHRQCWLG